MIDYVDKIVAAYNKASGKLDDDFSAVKKKKNTARTSTAPDDLFVVDEDGGKLSEEGSTAFHNLVAKTMYVGKRARPDVSTAIAFTTTRVRGPDINDYWKLSYLMEYLRVDRLCPLILSADGSRVLMWYIDASFAVHPNMRSHTGGGLTMGRGFPIVSSTKQKLNTQRSTESELVGVDDMMPIVIWSQYFLMAQGYGITWNLLLQDNESSILLERNGKASSGKQTWHINIQYFFITDRANLKKVEIKWCPIKEMMADFMTKPIQQSHFRRLRVLIIGMTSTKKAKIPSNSTVTVTKRDGCINVRVLERRLTAVRHTGPTSSGMLAQ